MNALAPVLGDRDAKVRLAAIKALVTLRSGTGPPKALLSALDDASAENRAAAIRSLWSYRQGLNPWVPALLRVASKDPDPSVQDEILSMWNNAVLRPPAVTAEVVPFLIASLRSSDFKVRVLAARLLPYFGAAADEAIPELLRVLNEPLEPGVETMANKPGIWDPAIQAAWALEQHCAWVGGGEEGACGLDWSRAQRPSQQTCLGRLRPQGFRSRCSGGRARSDPRHRTIRPRPEQEPSVLCD